MKTERELFEEWFKTTKWFTGDNCTPKYQTYRSMLQAWQASANRDGYKLVPVEPTQEMIGAIDTLDILTVEDVYKAMLGATP